VLEIYLFEIHTNLTKTTEKLSVCHFTNVVSM